MNLAKWDAGAPPFDWEAWFRCTYLHAYRFGPGKIASLYRDAAVREDYSEWLETGKPDRPEMTPERTESITNAIAKRVRAEMERHPHALPQNPHQIALEI